MFAFLDKDRSVAGPGYNRWLAPPAALAIHLSIGQVYAWSVFNKPLAQLVGISKPADGDWSKLAIGWIFSIAIAVLGLTAAFMGKWLERNGPRKAMVLAAICFGGGFLVGAAGVATHQLWLLYLGYGVIGGFGLGLGYLAPVANLVRWFNDRPGLATGMAIMGFGGGAMIGSPLAQSLMHHFAGPHSVGVAPTMVVMGVIYFAFMLFGAAIVRVPPADYRPAGMPAAKTDDHGNPTAAGRHVPLAAAFSSYQFWLLWIALCVNTTAGISLIEGASPLIQEFFGRELGATPAAQAAAAAGFVGFISLFNMGGRFFWSTISDYIGRKATFAAFFVITIPCYVLLTHTDTKHWNSIVLFVAFVSVVLSVYGGGFSTMPAYLRDLFGTRDLNAIYGRMLTAWSVAGVAGPLLVNALRKRFLASGMDLTHTYGAIYYVMAGLLAVGLLCDLLVRPVAPAKADTPAVTS